MVLLNEQVNYNPFKYLKLPYGFIAKTLYGSNRASYYEEIRIPKPNGKERVLHAVTGRMKILQKNTYERLSQNYKPTSRAKGFVKGESTITHALQHRNKKLIITFDIEDFFPQ